MQCQWYPFATGKWGIMQRVLFFIWIILYSCPVSRAAEEHAIENDVVGNAILCFQPGSQIPQFLREKDPKTGVLLHPELQNQHLDLIQSVESLDYFYSKKKQGLDEVAENNVIEPLEGETSGQYVERVARRFDYTIPVIGQKIRRAREIIPEKSILRKDFRLGSIQDQNIQSEIDDRNCIVAPLSRVIQTDTGYQLEYDAGLLSKADQLARSEGHLHKSRILRAVSLLGDYLYLISLMEGKRTRDAAHQMMPYLIGVGDLSIDEIFKAYVNLGFPSDVRFAKGDVRNFYPLMVMQEALDLLWNNEDSVYRKYENKIVEEVILALPRLKGCEFFGRKPEGQAYPIFDCRYLMLTGYWFPPIPPAMEMSDVAKIKALSLVEKYSQYESEFKQLLKNEYFSQLKPMVLKIPYISREQVNIMNAAIERELEDVLLPAHFAGKKDKRDREIAPDYYGLKFDYILPQVNL